MSSTVITLALAAVVLVGCTSTSSQEHAISRSASATTGPATTDAQIPAPTAPSTVVASPPPTGAPRSSPPRPRPSPRRLLLTPHGLGGVPVGATLKRFAKALGRSPTPMNATERSVFADHSCVIRQLAGLRGVGLMVIGDDPDGQVRRISIFAGSDIRTDTRIGLGSSLDAVRAAYGPGLGEPFDHFPVGGDAVLVRAGANVYQVFVGDDRGRVVELRLGYKPEALYPEGCV